MQRTTVDIAFEFDDLIDRIPVAHPSPVVEFRLSEFVQFNLTVIRFESQQKQHWLRTYQQHEVDTHPLKDIGQSDITTDVDISQLARVVPPTSIRTQAQWLLDLGLESLVEKSKQQWKMQAHNPDLKALEARSAIGESEALTDLSGLGSFKVLEWSVKS